MDSAKSRTGKSTFRFRPQLLDTTRSRYSVRQKYRGPISKESSFRRERLHCSQKLYHASVPELALAHMKGKVRHRATSARQVIRVYLNSCFVAGGRCGQGFTCDPKRAWAQLPRGGKTLHALRRHVIFFARYEAELRRSQASVP
jgi:hypothetical protein